MNHSKVSLLHQRNCAVFMASIAFHEKSFPFQSRLPVSPHSKGCQVTTICPCTYVKGFARWLLANLQAYPNEEFQRLSDVVLAIPVNITNMHDGKLERMPCKISRHALPRYPDNNARKLLDEALDDFTEETISASPLTPAHLGLSPTTPSFPGRSVRSPEPSPHDSVLRYTSKSMHIGQEILESPASSPTEYPASSYLTRQSQADEPRGTCHHSLPAGTASEAQLPPLPVGNTIQRSPDSRRHSHSAITVTRGKPLLNGSDQAPQLRDTRSFLSTPGTYGLFSVECVLPTLSAAQVVTIRDIFPRREREKQYCDASKQMSNPLTPLESDYGDSTPRGSGSYRRAETTQKRYWDSSQEEPPANASSLLRRPKAALDVEHTRGGPTWDEYLRKREA
ncbi:hypothetical protein PpBr36_01792 [Pyricularia pennisetigena]|uniref:hypothetical protein n=1 Tax=Pyricularia pennisetigena TaxID=1578925 RepID=UPI00114FBBA6|nr:hypothetical protein PpBr36_01792 [Pyricularia pennisetigena]TLS28870.1 hypothetical protein PpBr36_01792 [Pyricularia pennisetigena]